MAEVQGAEQAVGRFAALLTASLPSAARIESVTSTLIDARADENRFRIADSAADLFSFPPIPPDLPVCAECARELMDPFNRRYLYPFITCTQCGPRYSIVARTPFDRENTSMRSFTQCTACAAEYADPADRRFHSQTNSCNNCGPRLSCVNSEGRALDGDPLIAAISALTEGKIVAVEGIGGFHLAADPRHRSAMAKLRREKERERKPFALMVRDIEEARAVCLLSPREEGLLSSAEAPIVIAPRRTDSSRWLLDVSDTDTLGIMLPYTPLHLLLFRHPGCAIPYGHLVMTSGNRANEPIITDPDEAREKLRPVADVFLSHNRAILFRTDDSILRAGESSAPFLLRRSRGYVPRLLALASEVSGVVLGVGGDLKNAPSLARGRALHLCPFNGDLEDPVTLSQFDDMVRQVLALYGATPDLVVSDLHPLYHSSRWARELPWHGAAIQHHFAHALSVMAEHGLGEAIALTFDGTGYGPDGTVWGGEFLHATRKGFTRLGSFAPFALPGGEAAVLNPARIAFALLVDARDSRMDAGIPGIDADQGELLRAMMERGVNCPVTTSLGRVFDAASAILGLVDHVTYEGEGPIRLEGLAMRAYAPASPVVSEKDAEELLPFAPSTGDDRLFLIDPRPLLSHAARAAGIPRPSDAFAGLSRGRGTRVPDGRKAAPSGYGSFAGRPFRRGLPESAPARASPAPLAQRGI